MAQGYQPKLGFRPASEEDLVKLAETFQTLDLSDTEFLLISITLDTKAHEMGIELQEADKVKVCQLAKDRLENLEREDQRTLEEAFNQIIRGLFPHCPDCQGTDIKPRYEEHHHVSEFRGYSWTEIKFLYCSCGRIFFNDKVDDLNQRFQKGEFKAKPRIQRETLC